MSAFQFTYLACLIIAGWHGQLDLWQATVTIVISALIGGVAALLEQL